ncbi:SIS domain-containing protein [Mesorhizobium sp. WSM3224]|uniref:SIS domain-containing protein n=1 Tax=Mesorhizobium sp. WSM3224 TaxID=1040986 RepID=UPI000411B2B0|nr:SIS domain-containing protein [Mesorhizobium sp. WSM3224]
MALETAQAPAVVERMLLENASAIADLAKLVRKLRPSYLVTCARGSSDHAASYFKYLSEIELGIPCCSVGASVVSIYSARLFLRDTLLLTISQSGRSPDILSFQAEARRAGVPTVAITNDSDSPLAKEADICLPLHAGPELSVAATKTYIASASLAAAIIAALAGHAQLSAAIHRLPADLQKAQEHRWAEVEDVIADATSLYVLGRGPSLPMAQEAALKFKETSGLHAEAFSAAEVMHGPMELVEERFPILVFAPKDAALSTTVANVERLKRAGAAVLRPVFKETLHPALDPISLIQSFYGSAERISIVLGRDPDKPRMLKKVTETT